MSMKNIRYTRLYKTAWTVGLFLLLLREISADPCCVEEALFVSLGSHCEVGLRLREHQLRKTAFPFDWLLTVNHERFIALLEDDFKFFMDERYLIQPLTHPTRVENSYYEVEFCHDWPFLDFWSSPERCRTQLEQIKLKYERRIARFRELRQYSGRVFFIRAAYPKQVDPNLYFSDQNQSRITAAQAMGLKIALDRFFPALDFTLVIINPSDHADGFIDEIDGILEFKLHESQDYAKIFKTLHKLCPIKLKNQGLEPTQR